MLRGKRKHGIGNYVSDLMPEPSAGFLLPGVVPGNPIGAWLESGQ